MSLLWEQRHDDVKQASSVGKMIVGLGVPTNDSDTTTDSLLALLAEVSNYLIYSAFRKNEYLKYLLP